MQTETRPATWHIVRFNVHSSWLKKRPDVVRDAFQRLGLLIVRAEFLFYLDSMEYVAKAEDVPRAFRTADGCEIAINSVAVDLDDLLNFQGARLSLNDYTSADRLLCQSY